MSLRKIHGVPFRHRTYSPRIKESLETKTIRVLGQRIKEIDQETRYIQENGVKPQTSQSYFLKKLNTL